MQPLHKTKSKKNILIIIVILIVFFITNPFSIVSKVRGMIMVPFTPFLHVTYSFGGGIANNINMIFSIRSLYDENQELSKKAKQLESQLALLTDVKNENEHLRNNLNVLPRDKFEFIGAKVIVRDSLGGNNWITIDRGLDDGIEENMAVVVGDSIFVGYIDEIEQKTARVKLITHPDSVINVVASRTGAEAIARGEHGLSIIVEDINKTDDVQNGDMLITSDVGGIFPRGLSVGHVQNISSSSDELFQQANIKSLVSADDIDFVFVLKKSL